MDGRRFEFVASLTAPVAAHTTGRRGIIGIAQINIGKGGRRLSPRTLPRSMVKVVHLVGVVSIVWVRRPWTLRGQWFGR